MKNSLIFAVALVVIAISAYALLDRNAAAPTHTFTAATTYDSDAAKVSFKYPDSYSLESRSDSFEGSPITIATLTVKGAEIPDQSEGPPAISMLAIPNPGNLALEDWIKAKSISNFSLSSDKKLSPVSVGGEPGLAYSHSGLYENDAVAVARGGKIYLFSASWADASSTMRADFQNLLKTVTFK